jgi:4-amino-4-deoxy-L-arabinose transferase-like glycosyltransferase
VGSIYFLFARRRQKTFQPTFLLCGLFMLSAFFLIPFQRYLVPFLPILIVLGVAGLAELFNRVFKIQSRVWRAVLAAVVLAGLCVPNIEAYGIYPAMGAHLDWRDAIHAQEWNRVVAAVPAGRIATPNARSLLFYSNLQNARQYHVEQFNENKKEFTALVERAENDWIVLPKYPPYAALIQIADISNRYRRIAEFDYTIIYRKDILDGM